MNPNEIGELGEGIFNVAISRDLIFRPRHLGEKWPSSDFYVELVTQEVLILFGHQHTKFQADHNKL